MYRLNSRLRPKTWPLWQKILATLTLSMFVPVFFSGWLQYRTETEAMQAIVQQQNNKNFQLLRLFVGDSLFAENLTGLQNKIDWLVGQDRDLYRVRIIDSQQRYVFEWQRSEIAPDDPLMQYRAEITLERQPGVIEASWSMDRFNRLIERKILQTQLFMLVMMFAPIGIGMLLLFKQVIRPIKRINALITRYLSDQSIAVSDSRFGSKNLIHLVTSVTQLGRAYRLQRKTENELRWTKKEVEYLIRRNNLILNSAGEGVYVIDQHGYTIFANQAAEEMTGYTAQELIGFGLNCLFQPPGSKTVATHCAHCLLQTEMSQIAKSCHIYASLVDGKKHQARQASLWHKNGRRFFVEYVSTPIIENGVLSGVVVVFRDIAQRLKAQQQIKDSEALKQAMLDSSLDAIITIDEKGLICEFNHEAEKMFRCKKTAVMGQVMADIIMPPSARDAYKKGFEPCLVSGRGSILRKRVEVMALRSNGEEFPVEVMVTPITLNNRLFFTAFLNDITAQKKARLEIERARVQAEKANAAKSQFLAVMSHEIRTPLNAIIGINDLLQTTQMTAEQSSYLDIAQQSSYALREIINDVLDFSKIEAGKLRLELQTVNPIEIVDLVLFMMAAKAKEKDLALFVNVDYPIPKQIEADPVRLKQILINLIANAVKFTKFGHVEIRLEKFNRADGDFFIKFSVTDTGIGIAENSQKDLFSEFSQLDLSTTRQYGGTGLGLAISSRLVEMSGGEIGVDSSPGVGSTFWFTLPASQQSCMQPEKIDNCSCWLFDGGQNYNHVLYDQLKAYCTNVYLLSSLQAIHFNRQPCLLFIDESQLELIDIDQVTVQASQKLIKILVTDHSQPALGIKWSGFFHRTLIKPVQLNQLQQFIVDSVKFDRETKTQQKHGAGQTFSGQGFQLLLVEDSLANQRVIKTMLSKNGFTVELAGDGLEATEMAAEKPYDAILMDLSMPVMDGISATRQIRAMPGYNQRTPIIALTANAFKEDQQQCRQVGMDGFLTKPLSLNSLLVELQRFLKIKPATNNKQLPEHQVEAGQIINHQTLETLKQETSEQLFAELISVFIEQGKLRVDRIEKAIDTSDFKLLEAEIHSFKSESGTFGALQLSELTTEINSLCRQGDKQRAFARAKKVKNTWAAVLQCLETIKKQPL